MSALATRVGKLEATSTMDPILMVLRFVAPGAPTPETKQAEFDGITLHRESSETASEFEGRAKSAAMAAAKLKSGSVTLLSLADSIMAARRRAAQG